MRSHNPDENHLPLEYGSEIGDTLGSDFVIDLRDKQMMQQAENRSNVSSERAQSVAPVLSPERAVAIANDFVENGHHGLPLIAYALGNPYPLGVGSGMRFLSTRDGSTIPVDWVVDLTTPNWPNRALWAVGINSDGTVLNYGVRIP